MLSRRTFLKRSSLVSLYPVLPHLFGNTARAAGAAPDARTLVVIQLDGGNDGINTVVPYKDEAYGSVRDKLRLDVERLHQLDDHAALHSNMRAAKELFDDGRLAIVQGVGYPNPNRSHFSSMRIWQTARFDETQHDGYGWLGRSLDRRLQQDTDIDRSSAIYVGEQETPVALWARKAPAMSLSRADDLRLDLPVAPGRSPTDLRADDSLNQFVSRQTLSAYAAADEFQRNQSLTSQTAGSSYPDTALAARMRLISQLLQSGSQARVFYTAQGGYDTHSAQIYTHSRLLREFSDALKAFLDDLRGAGLGQRVVVLAFSEFGRRVQENASQGTDHGTAGPVFLAGEPVHGGLTGEATSLSDLEDGDLKMQFDFRQVYATILDRWLDVDSREVLGEAFEPLPIMQAS